MTGWKTFVAGKSQEVKLDDPISELIVKRLGADLPILFLNKSPQEKTEYVMNALSRLGKEQGFRSMAKGISDDLKNEGFKKAEWLYDLHWYQEIEPTCYRMIRLPLVVESEWDWIRDAERKKKVAIGEGTPDVFGEIKWDFQKLLVANAELRLMIFQERIEISSDVLNTYFRETIDGYKNLEDGSKFLFIAFEKNGFNYTEKIKGRLNPCQ